MSLVVVDVGNTSTAVGIWTKGDVKYIKHCDGGFEEASRAVDELLMISTSQTLRRSLQPLLGYSSVVPKADRKWKQFAKSRGLELLNVSCDMFEKTESGALARKIPHIAPPSPKKRPSEPQDADDEPCAVEPPAPFADAAAGDPVWLRIDYPAPETIGADRLADAAGAVARYCAPVMVLDMGTAFTAAVITANGAWHGGVIAPGLPAMRDYLAERTAKLPKIDLNRPNVPKFAHSTEDAMFLGAIIGFKGLVREIVSYLRNVYGEDFRIVATGGFARRFVRQLDLPMIYDSNLTLFGIGVLALGDAATA